MIQNVIPHLAPFQYKSYFCSAVTTYAHVVSMVGRERKRQSGTPLLSFYRQHRSPTVFAQAADSGRGRERLSTIPPYRHHAIYELAHRLNNFAASERLERAADCVGLLFNSSSWDFFIDKVCDNCATFFANVNELQGGYLYKHSQFKRSPGFAVGC